MGPRNWLAGDDEEDYGEEEGAEPEESFEEMINPDAADDIHPSTAAPDSDVPAPAPAKRVAPGVKRRPPPTKRAKAAIKRIMKPAMKRKPAKKIKRKQRVRGVYIP